MTMKEYATLQRLIGQLEGYGYAMPNSQQGAYFDTICAIDEVIKEMLPEEEA